MGFLFFDKRNSIVLFHIADDGDVQLVQLLLPPHKMTGHFVGSPRTIKILGGNEVRLRQDFGCAKMLGVEQKQQKESLAALFFGKGNQSSFSTSPTMAMCSSSSCFCSTVEGAPIMIS